MESDGYLAVVVGLPEMEEASFNDDCVCALVSTDVVDFLGAPDEAVFFISPYHFNFLRSSNPEHSRRWQS